MSLWGAVGLLVLVAGFGIGPGAIPGEVLLIVLTVIMAASAMEVAGGVDFLVRVAECIIRKNPKEPEAGDDRGPAGDVRLRVRLGHGPHRLSATAGHLRSRLESGIRPERPMAIATIASLQAITASPVSAATAAMIGLLAPHHLGLVQILLICMPSTLLSVVVAAFVQLRVGRKLEDDPECQRRLKAGELAPRSEQGTGTETASPALKRGARASG